MKLLWIIPFTTHKNTPTAGSQLVYNYYQNLVQDREFEISYIGLTYADPSFYLMQESFISSRDFSFIKKRKILDKAFDFVCYKIICPFFKYLDVRLFITNYVVKKNLRKSLERCIEAGYKPDTILLEFSHSGVLIDIVKKYFPESKCVLTAHDLFYINISRQFANELISQFYSNQFKKFELKQFRKFDKIITYNYKDLQLLEDLNLPVSFLSPFFNTWNNCTLETSKDGIVFWGALYREENYSSIFWFLENVWSAILEKNPTLKFYIVGSGLSKNNESKINAYKNVFLTGYVSDPSLYFKKSYCMVVPLFKGAGIKIKVLESFSASLPVVSTSIGVEGIPVENMKHCVVCEDSESFILSVNNLIINKKKSDDLVFEAHQMLESKFNIKKSYQIFSELIK